MVRGPVPAARPGLAAGLLLALGMGVCALPAAAQPGKAPAPELPPPRAVQESRPEILPTEYGAGLPPGLPVTLLDVLKLASLGNLDIAQARLLVERARASLLAAQARYLPSANFGTTYTAHDGQIQRTEGNVITVNRDSLFVGLGPSLSVNLAEMLFLPAEGKRLLEAVRIGQIRVTNDTLLRVADAYLAVLLAQRRLAAVEEGLEFLTSTRQSPLRGDSQGLLPLIRAFVRSGNALPSDQARVESDVVRLHAERVRLAEEIRRASAELARLLRIDPTQFLVPADDYRWPLPIHGTAWGWAPLETLVGQALRSRPELAENNALMEAAIARYRAAQWQPLLPTLGVNYSWGGFGGGPPVVGRTSSGTLIFGHSGTIANFDTRGDFDISLAWRLQGLGVGNVAQQRDARIRVDQSRVRQVQLQDLVVSQVVRALESVHRGKERVAIIQAALFDAGGKPAGTVYRSLRLNFLRIKGGQGTPLEVLDSTRRLSDVLTAYAEALTSYDRARFRLLVALGLPTPALIDPACMPLPPVPPPGGPPTAAAPPPEVPKGLPAVNPALPAGVSDGRVGAAAPPGPPAAGPAEVPAVRPLWTMEKR